MTLAVFPLFYMLLDIISFSLYLCIQQYWQLSSGYEKWARSKVSPFSLGYINTS
jgi:hypothetical protein